MSATIKIFKFPYRFFLLLLLLLLFVKSERNLNSELQLLSVPFYFNFPRFALTAAMLKWELMI
jgi:hypothetical protein